MGALVVLAGIGLAKLFGKKSEKKQSSFQVDSAPSPLSEELTKLNAEIAKMQAELAARNQPPELERLATDALQIAAGMQKAVSVEELARLFGELASSLGELAAEADSLGMRGSQLHIDAATWSSLMQLRDRVRDTIRSLRAESRKARLPKRPRKNELASGHKTAAILASTANDIEYAMTLWHWHQRSGVELQPTHPKQLPAAPQS